MTASVSASSCSAVSPVVTTVRPGVDGNSWASAPTVDPASSSTVSPGRTSAAAAVAIIRLAVNASPIRCRSEVSGCAVSAIAPHVTIPMLAPAIGAAVLLRSIDALKTFDILYATKGRGGGSNNEAETLNILAYGESFEYSQYGSAAALLILFFILIMAVLATIALLRRKATRV